MTVQTGLCQTGHNPKLLVFSCIKLQLYQMVNGEKNQFGGYGHPYTTLLVSETKIRCLKCFEYFSRGLVLGLWSACASVGNIIGALMVSQVLHYGYDVSH